MTGYRIRLSEPAIDDEEVKAVVDVLKSRWLTHGPVVERFEKEFAEYIGVKHAIAVSSGTAALDLALKAINVGPGDEVIVPDFTFAATASVVLMQGARPVFADIELDTYTIDPDDVMEKVTRRTKAIIAVHLFGHPANMNALWEIAQDHKLVLIEDAAQAHGAEIDGIKVGSIGNLGAFSFYATKNMTTGEGGMITTNDDALAERIRLLRNHGQERKYYHVTLGGNYRLTSIQAAIGIVQLRKLDRLNAARIRNAEYLTRLLSGISGLRLPTIKQGCKHVFHQYVIFVEDSFPVTRDELLERFRRAGIEVAVHYPLPVHMQPLYRALGYPSKICPNSLEASKHVLSLPIHPMLSDADLNDVAAVLRESASLGQRSGSASARF